MSSDRSVAVPSSSSSSTNRRLVRPSASTHPPTIGSTSLRDQRILSESSYTDSLSSLIQRDFFPQLPRLKAENAYLAALEDMEREVEGAEERLREAEWVLDGIEEEEEKKGKRGKGRGRRKRSQRDLRTPTSRMTTPADTPLGLARGMKWDPTPTPSHRGTPREAAVPLWMQPSKSAPSEDEEEQDPRPDLTGHTLASFQNSYTSEDNASFLSLLHSTNARRRDRYAWAYRQEERHNRQRRYVLDQASLRADEGFARSAMALPEEKRRKLLTSGTVGAEVKKRVRQLEELDRWEQGKSQQNLLTNSGSRRLIRAASEEETSASRGPEPGHAEVQRARSASPDLHPPHPPLKHAIDPTAEISLPAEGTLGKGKVADGSHEEDPTFDPTAILRTAPVAPAAATSVGTKWSARNALFYGPDADIETVSRASSSLPPFVPSQAHTSAADRLFKAREDLKSQTNFHNTALPSQGLFPESKYGSRSSKRGGESKKRGRASSTAASTSSIRSSRIQSAIAGGSDYGDHFDDSGADVRERNKVNGYAFVTPIWNGDDGIDSSGNDSQERRLKAMAAASAEASRGQGASPMRFAIQSTPRREELAHKLASSSASRKNSSKGEDKSRDSHALSMAKKMPNTSSRQRADLLSPAARSLLDRSTKGRHGFASPSTAQRESSNGGLSLGSRFVSASAAATGGGGGGGSSSSGAKRDETMQRLKARSWDDTPPPGKGLGEL